MNRRMPLVFVVAVVLAAAARVAALDLVPRPASYEEMAGPCDLGPGLRISGPASVAAEKRYLADRMGPAASLVATDGNIVFQVDVELEEQLGREGYMLKAEAGQVRIRAASPAGVFYGVVTLIQLLPPAALAGGWPGGANLVVPACRILDRPRFGWRGYMLDAIVEETADLFPFEFLHIGGDEVNKNPWKNCTRCQALMTEKAFQHVGQVQNFFIRQMETMVRRHGRRMVGWNEILHGGSLA